MSALKRTIQYAGLSALGIGSKFFKGQNLSRAVKRAMANKMTGMKGIPLKINQILGMSEKDSSEIYRQALENIEAMPFEEVKKLIYEACPDLLIGATLKDEFQCASLGQVCHVIKDGMEYAVKVQYPDSGKNMNLDNKAFDLMTSCFQNFSRGFDMNEYEKMLKQELSLELDYLYEQEMQHEFIKIFSGNHDIVIPMSLKKYSTANCLVMSWEPSLTLDDFMALASDEQKKMAAGLMVDFYMNSVFNHGLLHADPNPGNFGFRIFGDRVQLVVYDFGSVVKLDQEKHMALLSLFDLCMKKRNPLPALIKLNFKKDLLEVVSDRLHALMTILLQPFLSECVFEFDSWNRKEKVNDILGDERWNFMAAAPADLFLFMRSVFGLFFYTGKLTGRIFCNRHVKESLNRFRTKIDELENQFGEDSENLVEISNYLIVSVKENGFQKVKLTLPATSVDNLKNFIPQDVESKLQKKDISLESLVSEVRRKGYKPQTVFSLVDENKEVTVFLE